MKLIKLALVSALLSTSMISTIAKADEVVLTPIQDTTGLVDPQDVCDAVLRPNPESGFVTYPGTVTEGAWVDVGPPIIGAAIGLPSGFGTPVYSDFVFDGTYFRNGGSPNVWGGASATTTYPQTQQMHETTQNQSRTDTFDCIVEKDPGGPLHGPDAIYPPGLQTTGNSLVENRVVDGPDTNVITDDDFIIRGAAVNTLICISPNNNTKGKPGTWTQKHGFLGSCTNASTIAGTTFIPSNNNPIVD